jgi:hypothetical protein
VEIKLKQFNWHWGVGEGEREGGGGTCGKCFPLTYKCHLAKDGRSRLRFYVY